MRNAGTIRWTLVQSLLKAAPVVELSLHQVPLDQVNMTLAGSTFAVQSAGFVAGFCRLWKNQELHTSRSPVPNVSTGLTSTGTPSPLDELRVLTAGGKRISVVGLGTKVPATTGRFFFPEGASLKFSAGRLTPPTVEKWKS